MQVRFWGTRGSLARPGPTTIRYGGNTSCVEVRTDGGELLILDCGTGAYELGRKLIAEGPMPLKGSVLISHTHWDHIQGIPFFAPFFIPGCEWDIYAPQGFGESLRETLAGQMEYTYFPVTPDAFGASIRYHNLGEGEFRIGSARVRTRYLNHPALTVAYRIEADDVAVVYACDHEPHGEQAVHPCGEVTGQDAAHAGFLRHADLVMHDAQYTAEEYPAKRGWGHSTIDYAVNVARAAEARMLAITHHDPARTDEQIDALLGQARDRVPAGEGLVIVAAAEGETITPEPVTRTAPADEVTPARPAEVLPSSSTALAVTADADLQARITAAARDEGLAVTATSDLEQAAALFVQDEPPLVFVDGSLDAAVLQPLLRAAPLVPKLVLGGEHRVGEGERVEPIPAGFSREYLRARIRTWLMRGKFAGIPACVPENEAERLAAIRSLNLLDTPPEERFDRFTRIAARLFDVPISLISLVDEDRQWFKSRVGATFRETPRNVSFCAHAILETQPLVVPDAHRDPRFADNALVVGPPRIRYYAGVPLQVDGVAIGTLCLIDVRPRKPSEDDLRLLRDLGSLVEVELAGKPRTVAVKAEAMEVR